MIIMIEITKMTNTNIGELKRLAWKVGVVYFQVHSGNPNPEFYKRLPDLKPFERVIEVLEECPEAVKSTFGYFGALPFFGAVSGGWVIGTTDRPEEVDRVVESARRLVVLPEELPPRVKTDDDFLKIEGMDAINEIIKETDKESESQ